MKYIRTIIKSLSLWVISMMAVLQITHGQTVIPFVKVLDGSKSELQAGKLVTLTDSSFFNPQYKAKMVLPYDVTNVISLKLNESAPLYLKSSFTVTASVRIIYSNSNNLVDSIDKNLVANFDTAVGASYNQLASFVFKGGYTVTAKLLNIQTNVTWDPLPAMLIENRMITQPVYNFDCTAETVTGLSFVTPTLPASELAVSWNNTIGADVYDLEWSYIDSSALAGNVYGSPVDAKLIFANNSSRATVSSVNYKIPLIYDNTGTLFFRVRPVQQKRNGSRLEGLWSSTSSGGLGAYTYTGHERMLNWQATTSFAEDGKRKTVVQYYDGSLRSRQTITKDNTRDTAIISESFYDQQGRPVIQVLPTPSLSNIIRYSKNFNTGINGSEYDKAKYDDNLPGCDSKADSMSVFNGSSRYYSPLNPDKSSFNQYIPNASNYPFTETEYTPDNTGRIKRQGGVGPNFQLGSGHETKYFYGGAPDKNELYALFGTEVGDASHYQKNMVRDANGQYSVSYVDMHGRTIATALAGNVPDSIKLQSLPSNQSASITEALSSPSSNIVSGLVMQSQKALLVTSRGNYVFNYDLNPESFLKNNCNNQQVCYDCLYDLRITLTNDCDNLPVYDTVLQNFSLGAIQAQCNGAAAFNFSFTRLLDEGSYLVTKKLSLSKYAADYFRDNIYLPQNTCKQLQDFITDQRNLLQSKNCVIDCKSCMDSIGAWQSFHDKYLSRAGITTDTASYRGQIWAAYNDALNDCNALCENETEADAKRKSMLLDMTAPSGQYANPDKADDKHSIFYSTNNKPDPIYGLSTISYLDNEGKPAQVYSETAGAFVSPGKLSVAEFSQKFGSSWAEALLPFHPEYCKLVQLEANKPSLEWGAKFAATETYAEAFAAGYLNPTGLAAATSAGFPSVSANIDPFSLVQKNKAQLEDSLLKYRYIQSANTSMWSMATFATLCNDENSTESCFSTYKNINTAFNSSMCDADKDMAWKMFREMYLGSRQSILDRVIKNSGCNGSPKPSDLLAAGHTLNFNNATDAITQSGLNIGGIDKNTVAATSKAAMAEMYRSNCASYISLWKDQLRSSCTEYSEDDLTAITQQLLVVCIKGADATHLFGSRTISPDSGNAQKSFDEVVNQYNASHNKTNKIGCNAEWITVPKPYDQQDGYTKTVLTKPSECECDKISEMKAVYDINKKSGETFSAFLLRMYSTDISQTDLDLLLTACDNVAAATCNYLPHPVTIPPVLQCNTGDVCVDCGRVSAIFEQYKLDYPNNLPEINTDDTTKLLKNRLFENYMNNRLGFSKAAWEYMQFMDSCQSQPAQENSFVNNYYRKEKKFSGKAIGYATTSLPDGNVIVGGTVLGQSGSAQSVLIKLDTLGTTLWSRTITIPGAYTSEIKQIDTTVDKTGFVVLGMARLSTNTAARRPFLIKYDNAGSIVWSKLYVFSNPGEASKEDIIAYQFTPITEGGYALAGTKPLATGVANAWVMRVDATGNKVWAKEYDGGSSDEMMGLAQKGDTIFAIGSSYAVKCQSQMQSRLAIQDSTSRRFSTLSISSSGHDLILYKIAVSNGDLLQTRLANINGAHNAAPVLRRSPQNNGFYFYFTVLQNTSSSGNKFIASGMGMLDDNLNITKRYNISNDTAMGLGLNYRIARNGDVIVQSTPRTVNDDISKIVIEKTWIYRLDINAGTLKWAKEYSDGAISEYLNSVTELSDGSLFGTGFRGNNLLISRVDANGSMPGGCDNSKSLSLTPSVLPVTYNDCQIVIDTVATFGTSNAITIAESAIASVDSLFCNATRLSSITLCGRAKPAFAPTTVIQPNNCSDNEFFAVSTGTDQYNAYIDSLKKDFENAYAQKCLQAYKLEHFTVTHAVSEYHYTLYYYDQAGNLVKTIPPAGVQPNRSATWLQQVDNMVVAGSGAQTPPHTMATTYRYNTLNQVVAQSTPDARQSKFWYDRLGRLAISQNSKQVATNQFSYTLYDGLGRITETGQLTSATAMSDAISRNATNLDQWINNAAVSKEQITKTVYDEVYSPLTDVVLNQRNLRNRVSYTAVFNSGADISTNSFNNATFYSYDIHGNVDTLLQDYKQGMMSNNANRFKKVAYNYDLISGKVNYVAYQAGQPDAFYHRYSYDAENRLVNVETSHDSIYWEKEAFYQYYKHGPLARTIVGQNQVQGLDYAYTLQGWLKGVNGTTLAAKFDMSQDGINVSSAVARDMYSFTLGYYTGDYGPIGTNATAFADAGTGLSTNSTSLYNGNISNMSTAFANASAQLYNYTYDQLNRLVAMDVYKGLNTTTNQWSAVTSTGGNAERITYDANGNIMSLKRDGISSKKDMDKLRYNYVAGTNTLDFIFDSVTTNNYTEDMKGQTAGNYGYDSIGNLTSDNKEGINNIEWTVYGKIKKITKSNGTIIQYGYDAAGNRINKIVGTDTIWYVRDAQGNVLSVYNNTSGLTQQEVHLYGSSRLGIWQPGINVKNPAANPTTSMPLLGNGYSITFTRGKKLFELTNHLGNVLTTVSDKHLQHTANQTTRDYYYADIVSGQDYTPFGMIMVNRYISPEKYRYGFNGKENDNEVKGTANQVDFGNRVYDPRSGRWLSLDPLQSKQPGQSPYKAFNNNPIIFTDPDGKTEYLTINVTDAKTGKVTTLSKVISTDIFPKTVRVENTFFGVSTHDYHNEWQWYDKQHTINLTVDNGVVTSSSSSSSLVGESYVQTGIKSETWAKFKKYDPRGRGGTQPGGWNLVSEGGGADPTKFRSLSDPGAPVNTGLLLLAVGSITKGTTGPDFEEVQAVPEGIQSLGNLRTQLQEMAKEQNGKDQPNSEIWIQTGHDRKDKTGKTIRIDNNGDVIDTILHYQSNELREKKGHGTDTVPNKNYKK